MRGAGRILTAVAAILALVAGALTAWWLMLPGPGGSAAPTQRDGALRAAGAPDRRPSFQLPDLDGRSRSVEEWDGKVLVINFWATWCPPCRKEIPAFIALQEEYGEAGLQFLGIAIDDLDAVSDFVDGFGLNYPILIGQTEAISVSEAYGNSLGALPYTVVISRDGALVHVERGEFTREEVEPLIRAQL